MLAKLYVSQGKYEAAAINFGEVISCAPKLTRGYNNRGAVLLYLERTEEVVQRMTEIALNTPGVDHTIGMPGYSVLTSDNGIMKGTGCDGIYPIHG